MSVAPLDHLSDDDLLERFAADGDELAFAAITRRHIDQVYSACLRVLGDAALAEDAAQDTFFRLMRKPRQVSRSLGGWLHRTATRLAIDRVREDSRRRRRNRVHFEKRQAERDDLTWQELSPLVDEALESIKPAARDLLVAHFLEGRTLTQIAHEQGVSKATLSRRCRDALEQVRRELRRTGLLVTAAGLTAALTSSTAEAAPPMLAAEMQKLAIASGAVSESGTALAAVTKVHVSAELLVWIVLGAMALGGLIVLILFLMVGLGGGGEG